MGASEFIAIFAGCSVLMAIYSAYISASINVTNKRLDVILHCNSRYESLYKEREILPDDIEISDARLIHYFRRYWGLQSDQLDYWFNGYVDAETMLSWLIYCAEHLSEKGGPVTQVGKSTYGIGWDHIKKEHEFINPNFYFMIERIRSHVSPSHDMQEKQVKIHVMLDKIEQNEDRLIKTVGTRAVFRRNVFRVTMKDLAKTYESKMVDMIRGERKTWH